MVKFDPFHCLDCARVEGEIQGKEGIKFCSVAKPWSSEPEGPNKYNLKIWL